MKEVLDTVRFLKENMVLKEDVLSKEEAVTKGDLVASEQRVILGVCGFIEDNITPQLDAMGKDITLIKTALQRPILHY